MARLPQEIPETLFRATGMRMFNKTDLDGGMRPTRLDGIEVGDDTRRGLKEKHEDDWEALAQHYHDARGHGLGDRVGGLGRHLQKGAVRGKAKHPHGNREEYYQPRLTSEVDRHG